MSGRRGNGEGSIDRHHNHPTCPALAPEPDGKGGVVMVRPRHRCQGPYRARATVTVNGQRVRRTVYGKTKDDVLANLRKLNVADTLGTLVSGKPMTVAEWIERWYAQASRDWKINTRKANRQRINTWITPHLGRHRLDRLTPADVQALYATMRAAGRAEGTVRQVHVMLGTAYRAALRNDLVARNVMDRVVPPKTGQAMRDVMTPDQARAVLRAAGEDPRAYVALLCGLRQGEALALRWCDVYGLDTARPYLVVCRSVCREVGVGLVFTTPKSEASRDRIVPLLPEVATRLQVQHARHLANGWTDPEGLVFCTGRRTPYSSTQDRVNWDRLLTKAGVGAYTLHSARNTCAHLLEDAGVMPRVVADILGHSTVAVTYRYQAGNVPAKVAAMDALAALVTGTDEDGEDDEGTSGALAVVA